MECGNIKCTDCSEEPSNRKLDCYGVKIDVICTCKQLKWRTNICFEQVPNKSLTSLKLSSVDNLLDTWSLTGYI